MLNQTSLKSTLTASALAATLGLAAMSASAFQANRMVDVTVIDRDQYGSLPVFWQNGQSYVVGEPGHRYSIRLANLTNERVLTVLSVDGVNAISGQTANPEQSGYVLEPYQSTEINGWRKNMRSVAQFVFTDKFDSYAAQTGRPQNVGVIGVAVYREARSQYLYEPQDQIGRQDPYYGPRHENQGQYGEFERRKNGIAENESSRGTAETAAAPSSSAKSYGGGYANQGQASERDSQQLGTGHGYRERSSARYTEFRRRSNNPDQIIEMFYDDYQALVDKGIAPTRFRHYADRTPRSFPGGFTPDPYR